MPVHFSPTLHGGPLPQAHWPAALQRFAVGAVHERQAAPWTPQVLVDDGVLHALFAQQPLGHELAVHLHTPCTHCWPWAHGPLMPHWQPPAAQLSERRSHAAHIAPFWPHCMVLVFVTQVLPAQQPVHEVESQTHWPPMQCWPVPQGAFMPQVHEPLEQVSALRWVQSAQLWPSFPHCVVVAGLTHEPLAQQPVAQFIAVQPEHMPEPRQVCPIGQAWHVMPPVPHAMPASPA